MKEIIKFAREFLRDIIRDIDILPEDSIYVFAEATIDPDQPVSVSPFILEAEIVFTTNNTDQQVTLIAWAQKYLNPVVV